MERFLKWGNGLLVAFALTITPFLLSHYGSVVEAEKSSTILSYSELSRNAESVIIVGKGIKDKMNDNHIIQLANDNKLPYQKYELFLIKGKNIEKNRIDTNNNKLKHKMDVLRKKDKEEKLKLEKENKKRVQVYSEEENVIDKFHVNASAYISSCRGCSGRTFTGYDVTNTVYYNGLRIIATDKDIIPLNSIVRITYDNISFDAISLDVGGAIKGYKIDLLVKSYEDAINFGRKKVLIEVIK